MSELLDRAGRRRSPATMPGLHAGRPPHNKGVRYPADPPKVEEIIAVMRAAGDRPHGRRRRALIVLLIARRGHEPPAVQIQAARDQRGDVDQSGDLLLVGGRLRGGRDGQHTQRGAPDPGRPRSVPANRSTASRWRSALGCT